MTAQHPCPQCGAPVPRKSGRGRPFEYCSKPCRRLHQLVTDLWDQVDQVQMDAAHLRAFRGELWRIGNTVTIRKEG